MYNFKDNNNLISKYNGKLIKIIIDIEIYK
jgi:hypothetical protein